MDEGKGKTIFDITENDINGEISEGCDWSQDKLEDGQPIEYEDKWGK